MPTVIVFAKLARASIIASCLIAAFVLPGYGAEPEYDGTSFVGLPVFSSDGAELGEVASETIGPEGLPAAIRIAVGQPLGVGEKTVEVSPDRYVGLRGAVALDYVADEVGQLPAASP